MSDGSDREVVLLNIVRVDPEDPFLSVLAYICRATGAGGHLLKELATSHPASLDLIRRAATPEELQDRLMAYHGALADRHTFIKTFFAQNSQYHFELLLLGHVEKEFGKQIREEFALYQPVAHGKVGTNVPRQKTLAQMMPYVEMLGKMPDGVIADHAGVSRDRIRYWRTRMGVKAYSKSLPVPETEEPEEK